ncbi:MAG: hypothetical protein Q9160_005172 [Pyrenula sp. 1 TL-2023]
MAVKDKQIHELRSESYNGSDDEWRAVFKHSFRLDHTIQQLDKELQALDIVASLSGKAPKLRLTITIRRKVSGITQKLGTVVLKQDEELELNAIDWACEAVEEIDTLRSDLTPLERNYKEAQVTIKSLEQELDELLKAKVAHEEALISKFAELLNEKKVKIRQQQRLLTTAKVDKKSLREMQESIESTRRGPKSDGKKGKRKAPDPPSASDSSHEFETMPLKPPSAEKKGRVDAPDSESNRDTTSTESGTETQSETGDEGGRREKRSPRPDSRAEPQGGNATSRHVSRSPSPPPPRELPFNRNGKEKTPPKEADPDSEATASGSDDEL